MLQLSLRGGVPPTSAARMAPSLSGSPPTRVRGGSALFGGRGLAYGSPFADRGVGNDPGFLRVVRAVPRVRAGPAGGSVSVCLAADPGDVRGGAGVAAGPQRPAAGGAGGTAAGAGAVPARARRGIRRADGAALRGQGEVRRQDAQR